MTNSVAFLCSVQLLIVLLSYTDGQYYNGIWGHRRPYVERQNDDRWYGRRWDHGISNGESWDDRRLYNERQNDERWDDKRSNDESNEDRSNDERRNEDRRNDERRNDERRNEDRGNNERRNEGRRDDENEEKCPADQQEDWSYRGNNGPAMWTRRYSECRGQMQSPVDINFYEVDFDADIEKLKLHNYNIPVDRATLENNGHTIRMMPTDDVQRVIHCYGRTYRLRELHFHWGKDKSHGSEHTINSVHSALEMHLVHQSDANQTAVVAVFFKEQSKKSKELQNIIQNFPKLMYKDNTTELKSAVNINNLLPANPTSYYWYEGSLTTPPCTEGVQWLLLPKVMPVGAKQMAEFRKLYSSSKADSSEHCKISNNYRPLQSRNGRMLVKSQ